MSQRTQSRIGWMLLILGTVLLVAGLVSLALLGVGTPPPEPSAPEPTAAPILPPSPTELPEPSPTFTVEPTPSPIPTATRTRRPTRIPTSSPTASPTASPTPTAPPPTASPARPPTPPPPPPIVIHFDPPRRGVSGKELEITVEVDSEEPVREVLLYHRSGEAGQEASLALSPASGSSRTYRGSIPGSRITRPWVELRFTATGESGQISGTAPTRVPVSGSYAPSLPQR